MVTLQASLPATGYWGLVDAFDPSGSRIETIEYLAPITGDLSLPVASFNQSDVQLIATLLNEGNFDPTSGMVSGTIIDCSGAPATGATAELAGLVYYESAGIPSATATSTDGSGQFFAFNAPPASMGGFEVQTFESGEPIGIYNVIVKPGAMTILTAVPNQ